MAYDIRFDVTQTGAETIDQIAAKTAVMKNQVSAAATEMKQAADRVSSAQKQMAEAVDAASKGQQGAAQTAEFLNGVLAAEKAELEAVAAKHRELKAALDEVTGAHTRMVPAVAAANAEFALMEGRLPTRALGQLATNVLGLGPLMQGLFPVFGAVAFVEVVGQIISKLGDVYNKWNPIVRAEQEALEGMKKLNAEYDKLTSESRTFELDAIERTKGRAARLDAEGGDARAKLVTDQGALADLQLKIAALNRRISAGTASNGFWDDNGKPVDTLNADAQAAKIQRDTIFRDDGEFAVAQKKITTDAAHVADLQAKTTAAQKQEDEEARRKAAAAARPGIEAANRRRENDNFFSTGLAKAEAGDGPYGPDPYASVQARVQGDIDSRSRPGAPLSAQNMSDASATAAAENAKITLKLLADNAKRLGELTTKAMAGMDTDQREQSNVRGSEFMRTLRETIAQGTKDVAADRGVQKDRADSQETIARRAADETVRRNRTAVSGGQISGAQGAASDYAARLDAAQKIFDIEQHRISLLGTDDEKRTAQAQAEKQQAEELYQAQVQYEESLDELREKDLEKYRKTAGDIFEALINRQLGAGHALAQLLRKSVEGQGSQLFQNVTAPILAPIGHALAKITGGSGAGIVRGTILDPANKAVPNVAQTATATNTGASASWLSKIYQLISGNSSATTPSGADPAADASTAAGVAATGSGAAGVVASAATGGGGVLGGILKLFSGAGSGVSSVLNGSALSTALGYYSGGQNVVGPNGQVTQTAAVAPTTMQQVGASVALAAAAGTAAYGIVSGIRQGGPGGDLKAAGSAVGLAASAVSNIAKLVAPLSTALSAVPIVGSIAAMALPLIGSLFGNGPVQRANQINQELSQNQYIAPQALNVTQDSSGNFVDFNARGQLRSSNFSAIPTVRQGSIWEQTHGLFGPPPTYYNVPGGQTGQFNPSSTTPAAPTTVVIQAMDAPSFNEFAMRNSHAIGNAGAKALQDAHGALTTEVQRAALG